MPQVKSNLMNDQRRFSAHQATDADSPTDEERQTVELDKTAKVGTKDVCMLTRHLATLLRAGMPLVPALSALVEQLRDDSNDHAIHWHRRDGLLAEIMKQVADDVNAGSTLAFALKKHPNVFSPLFVNMVAAGELGGTLEEVLVQLAEILEKRVNLVGKVKSAIAYPVMMLIVAVGVVVFLLSFVVPGITKIFIEMNRPLPLPTRMLISTSAFIRAYLLPIAIAACACCFAAGLWMRTTEGRLLTDRCKLKLPLFGKIILKLEIARLTRTLAALLTSGIPILSAMEIAARVVQNKFIARTLDSVRDSIAAGQTIAGAIRKTELFPPVVFHIIATGQISGKIETAFADIADMYEGQVDRQTKTLVSLLEPVILLVMGAVVGFIVLAVLLPIFEFNQVF